MVKEEMKQMITKKGYGNCSCAIGEECWPDKFNATDCTSCDPNVRVVCQFTQYTKRPGHAAWMLWFNLFAFYWAMNFVTSYGEMILAGIFAKWYWTKKEDKSKIPWTTLFTSIKNTTVYHVGTLAFGSLIIAIIKVKS